MTTPRDDGRYEVPIERLAESGAARRRGALVAALIVAVLGGALGLALLSRAVGPVAAGSAPPIARGPSARPSGGPSPALPSAGASGSSSASPTTRPTTATRIERLLDLPDRAVDGAPTLDLVERTGNDLRIERWTPGAGTAVVATFPTGLAGLVGDQVFAVPAPDNGRLLVLESESGQPTGDRGRLLDATGATLWEGEGLIAPSGAVWAPDEHEVVIAGRPRQWRVVTIDATGRATARTIELPSAVFLPTPIPIGQIVPPEPDPRTLPMGWSADGRWVYGGVVSPSLGSLIGSFRVEVDGSRVEPTITFGVGAADGLVPEPGTLGGRIVDPATGRIADWRTNADTSGGPPAIEVREADAAFAFDVGEATPLGSAWGEDGGLYVLAADSPIYPERTWLRRYGSDGTAGPSLLELGPIAGAGLIGVRDGFAALGLTVSRPEVAAQVVLVDVADPARATALPLTEEELGQVVAVRLR
jgi:hypothetical protein